MTRDTAEPTRSCAWPNVPLFKLVSMPSKFGWLKRFWASTLKRRFMISVNLKDLCRPKSISTNLGPWKMFLPRVPKRSNGVAPGGYAGLAKRVFGVPGEDTGHEALGGFAATQAPATPNDLLQASTLATVAGMPGKPHPI